MADDTVGNVIIPVGGDISLFQDAVAQLPSLAASAATAVNAALGSTSGEDALAAGAQSAATALSAVGTAAATAAAPISSTAAASTEAATALNSAGSAASSAGQGLTQVGAAAEQAQVQIKSVTDQLKEFGGATMAGGAGITLLTAPLGALGLEAIKTAGYFEQTQIAFTTLLGDAGKATEFINGLIDFAQRTPFEIKGLVDASRQLLAMGFDAQQLMPMLTTLGDAVAGLGRGDEGIKRLTLAFGEMQARGTVAMKEMNQLAMMGIPAMDILAKHLDMTHAELMANIKARTIDTATAIPILLQGLNDRFGGMMAAQSTTLLGMWTNVQDAITKTLKAIGDAILPTVKVAVEALFPMLSAAQSAAEAFGRLPEPIRITVLAATALAVAAGPVVLALGTLAWSVGNISTMLSTGAALWATYSGAEAASVLPTSAAAAAQESAAVAASGLATAQTGAAAASGEAAIASGRLSAAWAALAPVAAGVATALAAIAAAGSAIDIVKTTVQIGEQAASLIDWKAAIEGAKIGLDALQASLASVGLDLPKFSSALDDSRSMIASIQSDWNEFTTQFPSKSQLLAGPLGLIDRSLQNVKHDLDMLGVSAGPDQLTKTFEQLAPKVQTATYALNGVQKAIHDAAEEQQALNDNVADAQRALDILKQRYGTSAEGADILTRAQKNLDDAMKKAHPTIQDHVVSWDALIAKQKTAEAEYTKAAQVYQQALDAMAAGKATQTEVNAAWDQLTKTAKAAGVAVSQSVEQMAQAAATKAKDQIAALNAIVDVYTNLKKKSDDSTASQQALADVLKQVEKQANAVGINVQAFADGLVFTLLPKAVTAGTAVQALADDLNKKLPAAIDTAGLMINGKLVPFLQTVGDGAGAAGQKIGNLKPFVDDAGNAIDAFGNSVDSASGTVNVLTGNVGSANSALSDLTTTMVFTNDKWITADALLKQIAADYGAIASAAGGAAASIDSAASAEDIFASSGAAGGGGRGGRGGQTSLAEYLISILSAAGSPMTAGLTSGDAAEQAAQALRRLGYQVSGAYGVGYTVTSPDQVQAQMQAASDAAAAAAQASQQRATADQHATDTAVAQAAAQQQAADAAKLAASQTQNLSSSASTAATAAQALSSSLSATADAAQGLGIATQAVTVAAQAQTAASNAAVIAQAAFAGTLLDLNAAIAEPSAAAAGVPVGQMPAFATTRRQDVIAANQLQTLLASQLAAQWNAPNVTISVPIQATNVVGQNAMNQLADTVMQSVTNRLRQVTGLKLF